MVDRKLSGGVSVGIGLALETIFDVENRVDPNRVKPEKVDIDDYDFHIFNLHSIIRNVVSSLPKPNDGYAEKDLMNYVIYDINRIAEYYDDYSCNPVLAVLNYDDLVKKYNKNKVIRKLSKGQVDLITLNQMVKDSDLKKKIDMTIVSEKGFNFKDAKLLITTSMLIDFSIFGKIDLLEAHTGKLIKPHRLNKKYSKLTGVDVSHLPYNEDIHMILGDSTYIRPAPVSDRKELLAMGGKWTPSTTNGAIRGSILRSPNLRDYIR